MHDAAISSAVSTLDNRNPRTKGYGTLGAPPPHTEMIMKYGAARPRSLASARASYSPRFFRIWRQIERSNAWKINPQQRVRIHGSNADYGMRFRAFTKGRPDALLVANSIKLLSPLELWTELREEKRDLQHPFLGCDDARSTLRILRRDVL